MPRPSRPQRTRSTAVATRGLTHVAVAVRELDRTAAFYQKVVGAVVVYRGDNFVQMQTPGSWDVMVFEQKPRLAGRSGGIMHFGFRLIRENGLRGAAAIVRKAGGTVTETGEFVPGEPYLFARDPDGYVVELWYELPTTADPKPRPRAATSTPAAQKPSTGRGRRRR